MIFVNALEVGEVLVATKQLPKSYSRCEFFRCWSVTRAVRTRLRYVHHPAAALWIPSEIIRITPDQYPGQTRYRVFKFYFCHGLFGYIFFRGPHRALLAWGERRHKSPVCLAEWYKPLRFVAERDDQYKQPNDPLQTFEKKKAEKIHFLPIFLDFLQNDRIIVRMIVCVRISRKVRLRVAHIQINLLSTRLYLHQIVHHQRFE